MNRQQRIAWRDYVLDCQDLTVAQRIVLSRLATFADYPAGTNAHPGVELLVRLSGLKDCAVRNALTRGVELGLIEQTRPANPKRSWAAVYRLLPLTVSTGMGVPVETDSTGIPVPVESDVATAPSDFQPAPPDFQPAAPRRFNRQPRAAHQVTTPSHQYQATNTESRARERAPRTHDASDGFIDAELVGAPRDDDASEANSAPSGFEEFFDSQRERMSKVKSTTCAVTITRDCLLCDDNGFRDVPDLDAVERCDHQPRPTGGREETTCQTA